MAERDTRDGPCLEGCNLMSQLGMSVCRINRKEHAKGISARFSQVPLHSMVVEGSSLALRTGIDRSISISYFFPFFERGYRSLQSVEDKFAVPQSSHRKLYNQNNLLHASCALLSLSLNSTLKSLATIVFRLGFCLSVLITSDTSNCTTDSSLNTIADT